MLLGIYGYAAGDSASLRHFTIDNGLPSNNVYAVTQDKLGYMWFNTDNGVVKYDGYTFKTFTTADGLPSNDVWKLYPDKRGRLWVSTHANKIGYIKGDKYKTIITSADKAIHPSYINCDENNVYFLLSNTQLVTVDSNDHVEITTLDNKGNKIILRSIGYDNTLISLRSDSIIEIKKLTSPNFINSLKANFSLWSFVFQGGGEVSHYAGRLINVGIQRDYFLLADQDLKSFSKIYFDKFGGEKSEHVYTNYKDDDSLTIITNKAIYRIGNKLLGYRGMAFDFLPYLAHVSYYYIDNFGNDWYATNNGIWYRYNLKINLAPDSNLQTLYKTKYIGGLNNGSTYWLNKKQNTIYCLDSCRKIAKITPPDDNLPLKIEQKSDSEFYLYTDKIVYVCNIKRHEFKDLASYWRLDTVNRIGMPPDEIKFSTDTFGIRISFMATWGLAKVKENKWLLFNSKPIIKTIELQGHTALLKALDVSRMTEMHYDSADNIFILNGANSLAAYFPASDKYLLYNLHLLNNVGINAINGISCDAFSDVYILDNDRIWIYNIKLRRLKYLKCNFNLSDASIRVFNNYLFVAGKFGVAYAHIAEALRVTPFHIALNNGNYNRVYDFAINELKGTLYLSTDKGIIDINAGTIIHEQLPTYINNNLFMFSISYPIQHPIANNDTITLGQSVAKITLGAVNFQGDGNIHYRYIISADKDWQQTSTGEMVVNTFSAGSYYLVSCIVYDNVWVSKEYNFYIYRIPYWWQRTSWIVIFWISGILLFTNAILVAVLLTKRIVARANERKRTLTELELRAVYAQINPHFIFNTLSATLYFINRKKFDDAYVHVNKFSKLIRAYLKSSQERYVTLAEEIEMLRNYIELQRTRFEEKFEYGIEVDNKVPIKNIKIPSLLLQPLVENAINHGLFHRKDGGRLEVVFMQGDSSDELICIIDDNGVGRIASKEIKNRNSIKQESYGTKLTRQLIDVFKEFEHMNISLEYVDKESPETGTTVKLTIKNIKYVA
ncbi:MAG: histidine kinase [Flavipsychrobacter sp.]